MSNLYFTKPEAGVPISCHFTPIVSMRIPQLINAAVAAIALVCSAKALSSVLSRRVRRKLLAKVARTTYDYMVIWVSCCAAAVGVHWQLRLTAGGSVWNSLKSHFTLDKHMFTNEACTYQCSKHKSPL